MTLIELRAAIYIAVLLLGGWGGWNLASHHYETKEAAQQVERDKAIQAQQEKAIAQLQAQQAATQAAETQYATLKSTYADLSARFDSSLSKYTQVHSQLVSATSTAAALAHAAATGACSDPEVARLSGEAVKATLNDAAQLASLQEWATASSVPHQLLPRSPAAR